MSRRLSPFTADLVMAQGALINQQTLTAEESAKG